MTTRRRARAAVFATVAVASALVAVATNALSQSTTDSTDDWAVQSGFSLEVDTTGYDTPSAIAFVPNPGSGAEDPLYFVTELRGRVRVVTNDRSVREFATVAAFRTPHRLPEGEAQSGLAGICLDPERGYVFVTYTYEDEGGILRNNIARFETTPRSFAVAPTGEVTFTELFAPYQAAPAHQIGGCQVSDGHVFVGVGDGGNPAASRKLDQLLGKVLCLTVDGRPCRDSPFRDRAGAAAYVWAYGFRNPFGLEIVGGDVFVADNGVNIDRFRRVVKGADHHWDGSDQSLATDADVVFVPAISPAQLDYGLGGSSFLPRRYGNTFFMAGVGRFGAPDESGGERFVGVMSVRYDPARGRALGGPRPFVEYRGGGEQAPAATAIGPDGVYFAPLLPDARGETAVMRVSYDHSNEHRFVIGEEPEGGGSEGRALMAEKGCFSCHAIEGEGGGIGPSLDDFAITWRIEPRLTSERYEEQVRRVDGLQQEPFTTYRNERHEVLEAEGDERVRLWIENKILAPKFDDPDAQMPDLGLSEAEAAAIADYLLQDVAQPSVLERVRGHEKPLAAGFVAGFFVASGLLVTSLVARALMRRRRAR